MVNLTPASGGCGGTLQVDVRLHRFPWGLEPYNPKVGLGWPEISVSRSIFPLRTAHWTDHLPIVIHRQTACLT